MKRAWRVVLLLAVFLLLVLGVSSGWSAPQNADSKMPMFTAKERELIAAYYERLSATLAPGSLDRSTLPLAIEESLKRGSHVPLHLEKQLEPLPGKLESKLGTLTGEYRRYTLGHHVVLVKKADLTIADIIKNVAVK